MNPRCPKCGEPVYSGGVGVSRGLGKNGTRRWLHHGETRKICRWHGLRPIGLDQAESAGIDQKRVTQFHRALKNSNRAVKRYVITAAQNATAVHEPFLASLRGYCKLNGAELIVIPYRYRNPTSWSKDLPHDDWWAPALVPHLLDRRFKVNGNLLVMADIKTQPTANNPLEGFETISGGLSAVFGHPKLEVLTIPTPNHKLPKIMMTTGAVTRPNYIPSKAGKKGEFHHTYGAVVVEVDGDLFFARQLVADRAGSFCDLDYEYRGGVRRKVRLAALVLGDLHDRYTDPAVRKATFEGPGSMVSVLQPEHVVFHDFHDQDSRNHHDRDEPFINVVKQQAGLDVVERELSASFASIDAYWRKGLKFVFPYSNHPNEHLERWLKECDWRRDPANAEFYLETALAMVKSAHWTPNGAKVTDPMVYWAKRKLKCFDSCKFLTPDDSFVVAGVELAMHGHLGPNGARGSLRSFGKIGVRSMIGHGHGPGFRDGVMMVGTSSVLRMGYNKGPSNWLHAHGLLYGNGKRSLAIIIDGRWRA